MEILIRTEVNGNYKQVMERFDHDLFIALAPKFPKVELIQYDGSTTGDKVHIQFLFPKMDWISIITHDEINDKRAMFTDEGTTLPIGLKTWKHDHIVEKLDDNHSIIIDRINFSSYNTLFTFFMYPILYFSFIQRKPIYKSYFCNL